MCNSCWHSHKPGWRFGYALDAVEKHQAKVDALNLVEHNEDLFEAFDGIMSDYTDGNQIATNPRCTLRAQIKSC